ncbi:unnamed protein product [Tilletia controversa]|nr:unnamed protein product [Tilletia controversa]
MPTTACRFCEKPISVDVFDAHEDSCYEDPHQSLFPADSSEAPDFVVKEDPDSTSVDLDVDDLFDSTPGPAFEPDLTGSCLCGESDDFEDVSLITDEQMIGCEGGCEVWRHKSCADVEGQINGDWFCGDCREKARVSAPGPDPEDNIKLKASGSSRRKNHPGSPSADTEDPSSTTRSSSRRTRARTNA